MPRPLSRWSPAVGRLPLLERRLLLSAR
jgi:hypothetical protein